MSKKRSDAAAELAGRMLEVLNSRRTFGDGTNPPTLQELGEMCDGAPSPELIVKAATKKAFTDKAFVEKVHNKPLLDAPVYFKGEQPDKNALLARRMVSVLEQQRRQGEAAYPPTLRRLAELCGFKGAENALRKAATTAPMAGRATVLARKGKTLIVDAPVALNEDLQGNLASALSGLMGFALTPIVSKTKKGTSETSAFTLAELVKRVLPEHKTRFESAVKEAIERLSLPRGVGFVLVKGQPLLFLTDNVRPASSRPTCPVDAHVSKPDRDKEVPTPSDDAFRPRDFTQAFRAAFEILDRRNGSTNFVKIADLRQALDEFSREEFDAGLRRLRIDGVFSLDSHEGLHGSLSHEEREAGVREAGSLLVYASRR
jgi:hypothetical protein